MTEPVGVSMLDLDSIEARANATTGGPWDDAEMRRWPGRWDVWDREGRKCIAEVLLSADAVFIAAARTDVPVLIAEIRRLRESYTTVCDYAETVDKVTADRNEARSEVHRLETALTGLREQIANEIETHGREAVRFVDCDKTKHGRWRLIGSEDAYKDAIRIARGVAGTPDSDA